jgi:glucose/arabinose dehydrogenase
MDRFSTYSALFIFAVVLCNPLYASASEIAPQGVRIAPLKAGGEAVRTKAVTNQLMFPADSPFAGVLVVTERTGQILAVDLTSGERADIHQIAPTGGYPELGLVGFAFYPDFASTRRVVTYLMTKPRGEVAQGIISEWVLAGDSLADIRLEARRDLLKVEHPQEGHNGGQLGFGPDGFLYMAFGDGGFQRDPRNLVQKTDNFFGAMLRIDPRNPSEGRPYGIPADNPFLGGGHLPEVFAWGFRNPWRWTFAPDGRIILADVGQDAIEEVNLIVAGGNYGWSLKEGSECFRPNRDRPGSCEDKALVDPVYEYKRRYGSAIIGGFVYEGAAMPSLQGLYVFADHVSGRVFALELPDSHLGRGIVHPIGRTGKTITTLGLDADREILIGTNGGRHFRLVPR